jgi:hypothetical protein
VFRRNRIVHYDELDPAAFRLLGMLREGAPLVKACDALADGLDPAAADALGARVGPWFQEWSAARWIVGVHLD